MNSKRDFYFDNVKALLIIFVVFGHFIEPLISDGLAQDLYILIYSFHMPLFAFVSGFFSKNVHLPKLKQMFIMFLKYQLLFAVVGAILTLISGNYQEVILTSPLEQVTIMTVTAKLLTPIWVLWYLIALVYWKLVAYFVKLDYRHFIISIIVAVGCVLLPIDGYVLAIGRTISFLPFFILGVIITHESWQVIIKFLKKRFVIFVQFIVISIVLVLLVDILENSSFYYVYNYQQLNQGALYSVMYRIISYVISSLMCLFALSIIPSSHNVFSHLGKNTLPIFIYHGLIYWILVSLGFYNTTPSLLVLLVISLFISFIFGGNYEKFLFKKQK